MGDVSIELCGGTHVSNTAVIGQLRIEGESSVAAGIRRIEAITGMHAYEASRSDRETLTELSRSMSVKPDEVTGRVESLNARVKELEKEVQRLRTEGAFGGGADAIENAADVDGVKVSYGTFEVSDPNELKTLADGMRNKLGSGVGVLGAAFGDKVTIVATVTDDLIKERGLKAGDIVKAVAGIVGGGGGGKPHMAMAGGKDVSKLDEALEAAPGIVENLLKG
jgi:alanyl-tRNA synthetase